VATDADHLASETRLNRALLEALGVRLSLGPTRRLRGTYFLASSAGGVYAASPGATPYDEASATRALSPYGNEKLAQEATALAFSREHHVPTLIGRISNLYGPHQNVAKPQGLISQVGRAALQRRPISIYVPLDTIRDYLFVPDAALLITRVMERLSEDALRGKGTPAMIKIIASEVDSTVAAVLAAWRQALGRSPGIALASSEAAQLQPRRLSFRSRLWPELRIEPTPLRIGIDAVLRAQRRTLQRGELR
jgi:UDP-glucose 4-epimerase